MISTDTAARQILTARNQCYYLHITDAEMKFISSTPLLNDAEKIIWLNIAQLTTMDADLSCKLTYSQIAIRVGKSTHSIHRPMKSLKAKGFLQSAYDEESRLTTYYLDLPKAGRDALIEAPKRGQAKPMNSSRGGILLPPEKISSNNSKAPPANLQGDPLQDCNHPPCKSAGSPLASLQPLILSINNKTKKHKHKDASIDSDCTQNQSSEISKPMANANALVLKFHEKLESIRLEQPNISSLQANRLAQQVLSTEERLELHEALVLEAKQAEVETIQQQFKTSEAEKMQVSPPMAQVKIKPIKQPEQLDSLIFEGEHYFIERDVKRKLFTEIPNLYAENKIKLSGPMRSQEALLTEILYYITKVKCRGEEVKSQLNKYHIAKKYCQSGQWERPQGIVNLEITKREQLWATKKKQEIRQSSKTMAFLNIAS